MKRPRNQCHPSFPPQSRREQLTLKSLLFLLLIASSWHASVPLSAAETDTQTDTPPNVILIMADDLGYAELGCYGQKWIKTPVIDQLAAEGMKFTQFYAGNAVCAPSRCCLMTGKHPGHAETRNNGDPQFDPELKEKFGWEFKGQNPISDEAVTMAEVLKQKNYATAAIGKWGLGHFGTSGDPTLQGFDLFYGFNSQSHAHNHYPRFLWRNREKEILEGNDRSSTGAIFSQDRFREEAVQFIRENQKQPFFLYLPFIIPHLAIQAPQSAVDEYLDKIPEEPYQHKHKGYPPHPTPRAGYAAMVSYMDRDIGTILDLIKELQLDENTLVIFTSDNGPAYDRLGGTDSEFFESSGPFRGKKGSLYEGGIRVPLIAKWSGQIPAGVTSDEVCAMWDLLPTVAELTGTDAPEEIDGLSLAPTLLGFPQRQNHHDFLYWEFPAYGGQQALRLGNWKGVRQNLLKKPFNSPIELYNLESDPGEQTNLADRYPEIVEQIQAVMQREHVPSEIFPFKALDQVSN